MTNWKIKPIQGEDIMPLKLPRIIEKGQPFKTDKAAKEKFGYGRGRY
jgi:hypothetical protein